VSSIQARDGDRTEMTDRPVSTTSPRSPSQDKSPGKATLLRSGAAYTLASAIPRAVGFLLLPIFTRILSPADYGQLSVALSVTAVASILFALGFEVAVFRGLFQLEGDAEGRSALVRNLWTFLIPAPLAMAAVCWVVVAPILGTSNVLSPGRLALSLLGAAILVSATTVPLAALRADNRVRDYMILNGLITVTSTVLTLALVAWLRVGVDGWLVALIVATHSVSSSPCGWFPTGPEAFRLYGRQEDSAAQHLRRSAFRGAMGPPACR